MPSPFIVSRPRSTRALRLYCFPYAGGHAGLFTPWQAALEPHIEVCGVQLPGRGSRIREPCATMFAPLVEQIACAVAESADGRPFAFFGHSLGALLAFETARLGARLGHPAPMRLFLSGSEAAACRSISRPLHLLPDDQFLLELNKLNGTSSEMLRNKEIMTFLLPIVRADFALVHDYRYRPGPRLTMPITVLAGRMDNHGDGTDVGRWAEETMVETSVHWFDGDHFFINSHQQDVIARVHKDMLSPGKEAGGDGEQ